MEFTIKFQDGPVKEVGINGIQNEDLLEILIDRMEYLQTMQDGKYSCIENEGTLLCLRAALREQVLRTEKRIARGTEGTNKV
jgi:hypothetical protein